MGPSPGLISYLAKKALSKDSVKLSSIVSLASWTYLESDILRYSSIFAAKICMSDTSEEEVI